MGERGEEGARQLLRSYRSAVPWPHQKGGKKKKREMSGEKKKRGEEGRESVGGGGSKQQIVFLYMLRHGRGKGGKGGTPGEKKGRELYVTAFVCKLLACNPTGGKRKKGVRGGERKKERGSGILFSFLRGKRGGGGKRKKTYSFKLFILIYTVTRGGKLRRRGRKGGHFHVIS